MMKPTWVTYPWKFNIYRAVFIFLILLTWMEAECKGGGKKMKALHKKLMEDYNPAVRPRINYTSPTVVTMQLHISNILGMTVEKQLFGMRAYFKIKWEDEYLKWDPQEYDGIDRVLLPQGNVWKPDLARCAGDEHDEIGSDDLRVAISSEGIVYWKPQFYLQGSCKMDVSKYPYDVSVCNVIVYSWMSDNDTVTFRWPAEPIEMGFMAISGEYEISPAGVRKSTAKSDEGNFEMMSFSIKFARRPFYILISVHLPICLLTALNIATFFLPPEESAKLDISMTVLLAFTVFLDYVDNKVPHSSDNVCMLVVYIAALLVLSFLCVLGNVIVIAVKDGGAGGDRAAAQSNNFGNSTGKNALDEDITNINSRGVYHDSPEMETISSTSSYLKTALITKKHKCRQFFHGNLASKLNKSFLICFCIAFVIMTILFVQT